MTPMTYLNGSSKEAASDRFCRRKAKECQRTALTTTDPDVRLRFLHLAKLWSEMAEEAERRMNKSCASEKQGVVLFFNRFQK
jgi:hypothetical protein